MKFKILKKIELSGKWLLNRFLQLVLSRNPFEQLDPLQFRKLLLLRLDSRIGNGIMLLPLLNSIKKERPDIELHLSFFPEL